MSALTEEQRKKIEENRLKALERRAKILKTQSNIGGALSSSIGLDSKAKYAPIFRKNTNNEFWNNQQKNSNLQKHVASNSGQNMIVSTGNFVLQNKQRFIANVPYNTEAIAIFKTMSSKSYDSQTRKWSFDISEHDKLFNALIPFRPKICISPLPQFIFQALKKSSEYLSQSNINLMTVDPLLLEAFMPFQRDGVCFGISREGRVLIADDMGLGKTIQALGVAHYYKEEWPLLIASPSSMRYAWAEAVEKWISSVDCSEISVVNTSKDNIEGTVVILSYDLLARRIEDLKNFNFRVVIIDESHMLKNYKSARYKAASAILKKAKRRILLSGTPALSRPSELFTQVDSIDPKIFPNFQDYGVRYCAGKKQNWGWDFSGSSNMEELNIVLESTIMIRRLKSQVISQLPAKQRMTIILDPFRIKASKNKDAMKQCSSSLTNLKGVEHHGAMLNFFNETAIAKAPAVCDYIEELITENSKKFLVFAHHQYMLDKISETCEKLKVHYIRIDGSTSSEARQCLVDHFQVDENTRAAVLSVTAASSGITLTAAQLVVFAELYWNPGYLVQAEDRAHRIGQMDSVLVQYLVAKGTVDDFIWPMVQNKLNILNKVGLSEDDFGSADSENQKAKSKGPMDKYLKKNEFGLEDDDLFQAPDEPLLDSLNKRKRNEFET